MKKTKNSPLKVIKSTDGKESIELQTRYMTGKEVGDLALVWDISYQEALARARKLFPERFLTDKQVEEVQHNFAKSQKSFKETLADAMSNNSSGLKGTTAKESDHKKGAAMRFNEGKLRWSLVDFDSLESMVRVLEFGAKKYDVDNWKKGQDLRSSMESTLRHAIAIINGEWIDPESGLPHIGHLMCSAMFVAYTKKHHPHLDNLTKHEG